MCAVSTSVLHVGICEAVARTQPAAVFREIRPVDNYNSPGPPGAARFLGCDRRPHASSCSDRSNTRPGWRALISLSMIVNASQPISTSETPRLRRFLLTLRALTSSSPTSESKRLFPMRRWIRVLLRLMPNAMAAPAVGPSRLDSMLRMRRAEFLVSASAKSSPTSGPPSPSPLLPTSRWVRVWLIASASARSRPASQLSMFSVRLT
mmetsp:Transcript_2003/g.4080  ORF Transcript_2003/g.4080 Transcript_2003/m.4080 type:complete len:207 (+) Transcript_2003:49-669(+)